MENSNQGFSSWLKERIRPTWILNSQSQLKHYQVEDLTAELETQQVGRIEQCGNLEQIKAFSPALSHGLQQVLRLNEQLLRDVDRKSTRLNSSHVAISYAVFCLKKKTK